jgi:hypothetical protein
MSYLVKTSRPPVDTMGVMLANSGFHYNDARNLLDREEDAAIFLRRLGFDPRDIAVGLDEAIEIAREVLDHDGS